MFFHVVVMAQSDSGQRMTEREHPRVSELQDKMTEYVRSYLQTRLQGIPFMVTVKLEVLRRKPGSNYVPQSEKLPFYELNDEAVRDEWDDPSASIYVLQSRVQKATVLVTLPQELKDFEVQEIKDAITTLLRLIPGRDVITVDQRPWSLGSTFRSYLLAGALGLGLLLLGLLFISRQWARRLANAIQEIKPRERSDSDSTGSALPATNFRAPQESAGGNAGAFNGSDVKFRDTLRTREFVSSRIAEILKISDFPNLKAMVEMERLAQRSPRALGALLMEFPLEKQKEIFALSSSPAWLSAYTEPGELTGESVELADHLCRLNYEAGKKAWEMLLIQVWRMGEEAVKFLRATSKDEAVAILRALPPSVSIPVARLSMPGAWAILLDVNYKAKPLSASKIQEIYQQAIQLHPLNSFAALENYAHERDLLNYLRIASVAEEKDIYGAISKDSFIWKVRPPFFQVLELDANDLQKEFIKVSLESWALALFNVPREGRAAVESLMNSKQKFMISNHMRAIDHQGADKLAIGAARERIAQVYAGVLEGQKSAQTSESEVENVAA